MSEDAAVKAALSDAVRRAVAVKAEGNQSVAAKMTGLPQPDLSRISNGELSGYSVWRLMRVLSALGHNVTISVSEGDTGRGAISVRQ